MTQGGTASDAVKLMDLMMKFSCTKCGTAYTAVIGKGTISRQKDLSPHLKCQWVLSPGNSDKRSLDSGNATMVTDISPSMDVVSSDVTQDQLAVAQGLNEREEIDGVNEDAAGAVKSKREVAGKAGFGEDLKNFGKNTWRRLTAWFGQPPEDEMKRPKGPFVWWPHERHRGLVL